MSELSRQNQDYLVEEIIAFCEKWGMWKDVSNEEYLGKIKELGMNCEFDKVILKRSNLNE
jgi:hypothetical protein